MTIKLPIKTWPLSVGGYRWNARIPGSLLCAVTWHECKKIINRISAVGCWRVRTGVRFFSNEMSACYLCTSKAEAEELFEKTIKAGLGCSMSEPNGEFYKAQYTPEDMKRVTFHNVGTIELRPK